jgi:hypothetical protein
MPEILNKKQLEDAIKCRDFGTGCCDKNKKRCSAGGVGICIENAACTALTYRDMLELITSTLDEIMEDDIEFTYISRGTVLEMLNRAEKLLESEDLK